MSDDVPVQVPNDPRWKPIGPIDRRVVGVLVEKAKTVPSAYPMSTNAICTAANQKTNRYPLMDLELDAVEESLERLRELGAVGLIQGYGRVQKYRHYLYEWLGVEKVELAVMTELLLRGAQTEGDVRSHASRMEPIEDLSTLRNVLNALEAKGLVTWLTPEGRGRVVAHTLYTPREMEHIRAQFAGGSLPASTASGGGESQSSPPPVRGPVTVQAAGVSADESLRGELHEVRAQLAELRRDLEELAVLHRQTDESLERLRRELGA